MSTPNPTMIVPFGAHVAVDTQTLVWGGVREGIPGSPVIKPEDAEKEKRARILFRDLDEAKAKLVVPSVVVAELSLPILDEQHLAGFVALISNRFQCPPFDLPSAALSAKLWQFGHSLPAEERSGRTVLKADALIIATAKVHGARYFYTDDSRCRKLAEQAGLIARPLPSHSLNLFPDPDTDERSLLP